MGAKYGVGIDIGANYLRIAEVRSTGGVYSLTNAFALKIGSPQVAGRDAIMDPQLQEIVRGRLVNTPFRRGIVGLSGKDVLYRYIHFPPVPPWKLNMMVDYELGQGEGDGQELSYDYRLLNLPKGLANEYTVLASMAKTDQLLGLIEALKRCGLKFDRVEPSPLAVFNAYVADERRANDKTVLFVDIGASKTEIAILNDRNLYFIRTLPIGGTMFSEAIRTEFDISLDKAEELKITKGAILLEGEDQADEEQKRLSSVLRRSSLQMSSQIQAAIRFAANNIRLKNLTVDIYCVSGGGSRVKGMLRYWQSVFGVPVKVFNPLKGLDLSQLPAKRLEEFTEVPSVYTTAIGLALSAFDGVMAGMNILPEREKKRIEFFNVRLPVYAALALFFIGTLLFSLFNWKARSEIGDVQEALANVRSAIDDRVALLNGEIEKAESIIDRNRFIVDHEREPRFFLTVLDCFEQERPKEIWMRSISSGREGADRTAVVKMTVLAKESETASAHAVFEDFKKRLKARGEIGEIEVVSIDDFEENNRRLKLIAVNVRPAADKGRTGNVASE